MNNLALILDEIIANLDNLSDKELQDKFKSSRNGEVASAFFDGFLNDIIIISMFTCKLIPVNISKYLICPSNFRLNSLYEVNDSANDDEFAMAA